MNRLLVALLAAFDSVIAVAVGVAASLAPLTVLWAVGFGGGADWSALWPASVRLWQLGHLVPVDLTLSQEYALATGIAADAVTFAFSLAPLAFAVFTAVFAARSGARAARAGAWLTGTASGTMTVAVLAVLLALTAAGPAVAAVATWQAVLLPTLVFGAASLAGALVTAWRDGDDGLVDALYVRLDRRRGGTAVVSATARAAAIAVAGFVGVGALVLGVAVLVRGGDVVALYQAANVDALGATVFTLGQAAYLPTLIVWAGAFAAGPGFAVGAGTSVAASGTQVGVLPGIPVLGAVPPSTSSALLLVALLIVAVGYVAGATARARLAIDGPRVGPEPALPRVIALAATVVVTGAAVALLAVMASGAIGPDRLAITGPEPGPLALTVGVEIGIGAAIGLLAPRVHRSPQAAGDDPSRVE